MFGDNILSSPCSEANPQTYLPDELGNAATVSTLDGLFVLWVEGHCSCGNRRSGVAPDHKVPAEWGGGYMTDTCYECLGTIEFSESWRRVDRVVSDYSALHPDRDPTGGGSDGQ